MLARLSPLRLRGGAAVPAASGLLWSSYFSSLTNGQNAVINAVEIALDENPTVDVAETQISNGGALDVGYSLNTELVTDSLDALNGYLIAGSEASPVGA